MLYLSSASANLRESKLVGNQENLVLKVVNKFLKNSLADDVITSECTCLGDLFCLEVMAFYSRRRRRHGG